MRGSSCLGGERGGVGGLVGSVSVPVRVQCCIRGWRRRWGKPMTYKFHR